MEQKKDEKNPKEVEETNNSITFTSNMTTSRKNETKSFLTNFFTKHCCLE